MVRPGLLYQVYVSVLKANQALVVRASLLRDGVEIATDNKDIKVNVPEKLLLKVSFLIVGYFDS